MPDRREEILWLAPHPTESSVTINGAKQAMDIYATEMCLELLGYMAKNNVDCLQGGIHNPEHKRHFYFKKEWITAEQLFENFL